MPSPLCEISVAGGAFVATADGVDAAPGAAIVVRLVSQSDVRSWLFYCATTDELSDKTTLNEAIVYDYAAKTASFTMPAGAGRTLRFFSQINGGVGPNGRALPTYSTTFCLYSLTAESRRVMAVDETTEGDAEFGYIASLNDLIRNPTSGSGAVNDDIAKSAGTTIDRVRGIRGVAIAGSDGAPSTIGAVPVYNAVGGSSYKLKKPCPPGWYDITDYGLVGDGVTDNTAAWHAMLAVAGSSFAVGLTVYVPPGNFYFADDIWMYRQVHLRFAGAGGVGNTDAYFTFAPGKQLIVPQDGSPYGGKGEGSTITGAAVFTTKLTQPEWTGATAKIVGDRVHLPTSDITMSDLTGDAFSQGKIGTNWAYLECIVAGTTHASTVPTATYEPDFSVPFQALTEKFIKNVVRGTSGGNLITTVVFVCTTAGTTGASEPVWNTTPGATTTSGTAVFTAYDSSDFWVTDGTVVWACKVHAGILVKARCDLTDCFIEGSTNGGLTVRAGSPLLNAANGGTVRRVRIRNCGIGLMVSGSDANVWHFDSLDVTGAGAGVTGQGGYGIYDRSQLGNKYTMPHVANDAADGGGPSYRVGNGSSWTVLDNAYSESWGGGAGRGLYVRSIVKYPALTLLGAHGGGWYDSDTRVGIHEGGDQGVVGLVGRVNATAGGGKIEGYIGNRGDGSKAFRWGKSTYPSSDLSGISHSTAIAWPATDWWTLGYHTAVGNQSFAMPGYGAVWPVSGATVTTKGAAWVPQDRLYIGPYNADPQSLGFASAVPTSGHYARGAIVWRINPTSTQSLGWRCLTSTTYTDPNTVDAEATWEEIPWPSSGSGVTTATAPLSVSGSDVRVTGISGFGTAGQALRVNGGATAMEWFTPSSGATSDGSTGEVQLADGSGGFDQAPNVTGGSGWLAAGATSSNSGSFRTPNNVTSVSARDVGNTGNLSLIGSNSSNNVVIGGYGTNQAGVLFGTFSTGNFTFQDASTNRAQFTSTAISFAKQVGGYAAESSPFRLKIASITISGADGTDHTPAASVYECPILLLSEGGGGGGTRNLILPPSSGAVYVINNLSTGIVIVKDAGGSGVSLAAGQTAIVAHNGTDYFRVTADV